jgi:hypothetical protein
VTRHQHDGAIGELTANINQEVLDYAGSILQRAFGRVFFMDSGGRIGMGLREAAPSDEICVFLGGQAPYLIRSLPNGHFRLIGECYIRGLVGGELMSRGIDGVDVEDIILE